MKARAWEYVMLPMTGRRMATRMALQEAESIARAMGAQWDEHLLGKLTACADEMLEQDQKCHAADNKPLIW